ncbi:MAG TPA: hypothetical protein VGR84_00475 [Candidatus Acidoferrales bacterium]|nr:hypothetical protein [Candidatus Acidoferrales bacterium]
MPEVFLTASDCFADIAPDLWAVDWESYSQKDVAEEAAKFGIPAHLTAELVPWVSSQMIGGLYPNAFLTLPLAKEFVQRFVTDKGVQIIGIGLHTSLLPSFYGQLEKDMNQGSGLVDRVGRMEPLADGGSLLGYEPLGYEAMHFHTWLCHSAPDEAQKLFGIRPNQNGLISKLEDAIQVTENLVRTGAEPAIWEPWLLVNYSLEP